MGTVSFVLIGVCLFLQESEVVETWTHGVGRCDDAEGELLLHVALAVEEHGFWDGVLNVEEALFVSTSHALLDGDVAQFLVVDEDVGCASTIGGDEPEHEGEFGFESLVVDDILDEFSVLGITSPS